MSHWMKHKKLDFVVSYFDGDGRIFSGRVVSSRNRDYPVSDYFVNWLVCDFDPVPRAQIATPNDAAEVTVRRVRDALDLEVEPYETVEDRILKRLDKLLALERAIENWRDNYYRK